MKKAILLFITIIAVSTATSQTNYFTLTQDGFVNTEIPKQDYLVIDFNGKTQEQLYNAFLIQITTSYISAKDVVSKVSNEAISIHAYSPRAITVKIGHNPVSYYDLSYNISFQFKDNKIRVNLPQIISMTRGANNLIITGKAGLFNDNIAIYKKGTLKIKSAKNSIEDFFNSLISELVTEIKSNKNKSW